MATVTISHAGRQSVAEVAAGANLLKVLQDADVSTSFPCNGNHTCGKCRVIVSGAVSPMDEQERLLLGAAADSMRLACFTTVLGDCSVTMPRSGGNEQIAVDYSADDAALEPLYSAATASLSISGRRRSSAISSATTARSPWASSVK